MSKQRVLLIAHRIKFVALAGQEVAHVLGVLQLFRIRVVIHVDRRPIALVFVQALVLRW